MTRFTLRLAPPQHGWLRAELSTGDQHLHLSASDLSDAIALLVSAAVNLQRGIARAAFAWVQEPAEYRWIIVRDGEEIDLTILRFEDTFSRQLDEKGEPVFQARCEGRRFAVQVSSELHRLLKELGPEEYEARWGHPFPLRELDELRASTAQERSAR